MNNGKGFPFEGNYRAVERKRCKLGCGKKPIYRTEIKNGAQVYVKDGMEDTYHIMQDLNHGITPGALVERYKLSGGIDTAGLTVPNMGYIDNTVLSNDDVAAWNQLKNAFKLTEIASKHGVNNESDLLAYLAATQKTVNNEGGAADV